MQNKQISFRKTIDAGTFGEQFIKCILERAGIRCWKNPEATNKSVMIKWDLGAEFPGGFKFTLEVKFDQMEAITGNVAVEYFNVRQGKPSGILATTSNLWVFVLGDPLTAWVCRTKDLREWFESKPCHREISRGGDGNAAMKLYRRDELFKALFTRIDNLGPWDVSCVLKQKLELSR